MDNQNYQRYDYFNIFMLVIAFVFTMIVFNRANENGNFRARFFGGFVVDLGNRPVDHRGEPVEVIVPQDEGVPVAGYVLNEAVNIGQQQQQEEIAVGGHVQPDVINDDGGNGHGIDGDDGIVEPDVPPNDPESDEFSNGDSDDLNDLTFDPLVPGTHPPVLVNGYGRGGTVM